MSQNFGERLRALRTRLGMTPSALGHAVGVTEGAIRQMESGQTKSASLVVGLRLANVLGVTPAFLATGDDVLSETAARPRNGAAPLVSNEDVLVQVAALDRRVTALEAARPAGKRRKAPG